MQKISEYTLLQSRRWRAISYDWDILSTYGNTSRAYCLTDFQVAWLLSNTDYFGWATRWGNCPCTDQDMHDMKAELEYNLMNCVDIQPYQLQYLYDQQQAKELQDLFELWDGVNPSSVNANTPDDFYSGDGSVDRQNALCTACKIYVYSYAQNWVTKAQLALGIVAVVSIVASITIVGGMIATALVGGLALLTAFALDAMQDEDVLDAVACCMYNNLNGATITNANWLTSLDGCGFGVGTNEAIARDIIGADLDRFNNWLTFINQVGNSYVLAQAGVIDCPCEGALWEWISDFGIEPNIWSPMDTGYGDLATYASGWSSVDSQWADTPIFSRLIQVTTNEFAPTRILQVEATYDLVKGAWQAGLQAGTAQILFNVIKDDDTIIGEFVFFADSVDGDDQTLTIDLDEPDIKEIWFSVRSSARGTPTYTGSCGLSQLRVVGSGFNPFV